MSEPIRNTWDETNSCWRFGITDADGKIHTVRADIGLSHAQVIAIQAAAQRALVEEG